MVSIAVWDSYIAIAVAQVGLFLLELHRYPPNMSQAPVRNYPKLWYVAQACQCETGRRQSGTCLPSEKESDYIRWGQAYAGSSNAQTGKGTETGATQQLYRSFTTVAMCCV